MKIGILTVPFNNNYGGYLQAFALMTVLKRMGHEPTLIMRRHNKRNLTRKTVIKYFIKGVLHSFANAKLCPLFYNVERDYKYIGSNMHRFVDKCIQPQTPFLYSTAELERYCKGRFDAYIVGSDQVWRSIYVPDIGNYFLDFTTGWNVRRIAYAASFGTLTPEYTSQDIVSCRSLVQQFDAISLRENSGRRVFDLFKWSYDNLHVVLDPTLLLTSDDYLKTLGGNNKLEPKGIFYYVLDKDKNITDLLETISRKQQLPVYGISNIQKEYKTLVSIEEWLSNIINSHFVVTDSFHGMVFSIIFQKPFIVVVNRNRGLDRFQSLLDILGLEKRMYSNAENLDEVLQNEINWASVKSKLDNLREKSYAFLHDSLK